jgi:hypothetical protein
VAGDRNLYRLVRFVVIRDKCWSFGGVGDCIGCAVGLRSVWRGLQMKTLLPRRNETGYKELYLQWRVVKIGGGAVVRRRLDEVLTDGELDMSVDCRGSGTALWYMSMSRGDAMNGRAEKPQQLLLEARSQRRTAASRVTDGAGSVAVRAQWTMAVIGRGQSWLHPACARPRARCSRASAHSVWVFVSVCLWADGVRWRAVGSVVDETSEGCTGPRK